MTSKDRIRAFNDALRQHHTGGTVVVTRGVQALGADIVRAIDEAIARYTRFDEANDPYDEHDFGSVLVAGYTIFFKIDYYDTSLRGHSSDPSDPTVTHRVMTIMLADEY
jgi:hypothetical protein